MALAAIEWVFDGRVAESSRVPHNIELLCNIAAFNTSPMVKPMPELIQRDTISQYGVKKKAVNRAVDNLMYTYCLLTFQIQYEIS